MSQNTTDPRKIAADMSGRQGQTPGKPGDDTATRNRPSGQGQGQAQGQGQGQPPKSGQAGAGQPGLGQAGETGSGQNRPKSDCGCDGGVQTEPWKQQSKPAGKERDHDGGQRAGAESGEVGLADDATDEDGADAQAQTGTAVSRSGKPMDCAPRDQQSTAGTRGSAVQGEKQDARGAPAGANQGGAPRGTSRAEPSHLQDAAKKDKR